MMWLVPPARPVTRPCDPAAFETSATIGVSEDQVTLVVRSAIVPSLYVPVALSCTVPLIGIALIAGATVIDFNVAAVTVTSVVPVTPWSIAEIVLIPGAIVVADPPGAIETTPGMLELQVAVWVTSAIDLSE